ncbi:NAD(P)H-dependent oxidoreductase [Clostridium estertheticum]|uniref:flavodoxin n=1 Tax=Clostridium estertheticum TaxID=238834 RepID=UPI001C0AE055|nr:flavodoxin [Clostridium estertheticum]MBU3201118.1 NAD(P)H-dependent oxidoreductase [Clostridium estertheticum]WAG66576.1 NAD(P)H-dependent oxidoreductase [Clostridium estertheticum]
MKKLTILLLLLVVLSLTACNGRKNAETNTSSGEAQTSKSEAKISTGSHKVLVVYFSRVGNADLPKNVDTVASASLKVTKGGVQGNNEVVAKMIQKAVGGDLFLIQRADKLPADYSVIERQGQEERDANMRPKLAKHVKNMGSYDVVILVYPNWWFDMPMAVYSFIDEYDLSGKTIVPFCTSGGSGFSNSIETIGKLEPKATILEGLEISQDLPNNTEDDVNKRLSKIGFIK